MTKKRRYDWDIYGVFDFEKDDYIVDSHKIYSDLLNKQDETINYLRKDNLRLYGLLGSIRVLARNQDFEAIIKHINKVEKEMQE